MLDAWLLEKLYPNAVRELRRDQDTLSVGPIIWIELLLNRGREHRTRDLEITHFNAHTDNRLSVLGDIGRKRTLRVLRLKKQNYSLRRDDFANFSRKSRRL